MRCEVVLAAIALVMAVYCPYKITALFISWKDSVQLTEDNIFIAMSNLNTGR